MSFFVTAEPTEAQILHVAENMREWDRREIFATHWDDDAALLARRVHAINGVRCVSGWGDEPIAAFGVVPMWPGAWIAWMFATNAFQQVGLQTSYYAVKSLLPTIREAGAHWIEARSMEGHNVAHRWLEGVFRAVCVAPLKGYGRRGEDFRLYVLR